MSRFRSLVCGIVCVVVGLLAVPAHAAETRPHSSGGTAQFISPTDFVGEGHATHLGKYTEVGSVAFSGTDDPTVIHAEADTVYTAANGDQLFAHISGEIDGLTGEVAATVTYTGGTGRFTGATGSAEFEGQLLPGGGLLASVEGTISY
jgi:hypothetical protein